MKTKRNLLILFSILILSCGKTKNTKSETTELSEKNIDSLKVERNESLTIRIKEFINWYGENQTKLRDNFERIA